MFLILKLYFLSVCIHLVISIAVKLTMDLVSEGAALTGQLANKFASYLLHLPERDAGPCLKFYHSILDAKFSYIKPRHVENLIGLCNDGSELPLMLDLIAKAEKQAKFDSSRLYTALFIHFREYVFKSYILILSSHKRQINTLNVRFADSK